MLELLTNPQAWIAFATLTALELVLGIDNIIFISILVDKLPKERRELARRLGLFMAMFMRIGLLAGAVLDRRPRRRRCSRVLGQEISGRDLILILGGLFLIWKSTGEIHQSLEGEEGEASSAVKATFTAVILQIMVVDLVFSLDSIITAVGMVDELAVMIAAVIASVGLMMLFAGADRPLRLRPPDHQDAGAVVPRRGRRGAGRRRLRPSRAQGLRLLRDGILARRRDAQHTHAQTLGRAGASACAVCARKGDQHSALTCSDSVRRVPLLVLIQHSSTHRGIRARARQRGVVHCGCTPRNPRTQRRHPPACRAASFTRCPAAPETKAGWER